MSWQGIQDDYRTLIGVDEVKCVVIINVNDRVALNGESKSI